MKDWDYYYKNYAKESEYKIIYIILDGMPDIHIKEINGTPLHAANTPNLDQFAREGASGLIYTTIEPFIPIGSGPAHLALLGYEVETYPGRGALEALGSDIDVPENSVVIRMNFSTIDENKKVIDRRARRIKGKKAQDLFNRLNNLDYNKKDDLDFKVYHTRGYRGVLVLTGTNASSMISNSDPRAIGKKILKVLPKDDLYSSKTTSEFMNWFIEAVQDELSKNNNSKANAVVTRGAGAITTYGSFQTRYKFKNPVFVSGYPLYKGVAKFLGMKTHDPEPEKGTDKASIKDKFTTASKFIKDHDMTILHVKDPDIAGEDGDYITKKKIIEEIDEHLRILLDKTSENDTVIITSDHSTPCLMKEHSGHPVPVVMKGPFVRVDEVKKFSEIDCIHGSLGEFKAIQLMNLILMSTKRLKIFGA